MCISSRRRRCCTFLRFLAGVAESPNVASTHESAIPLRMHGPHGRCASHRVLRELQAAHARRTREDLTGRGAGDTVGSEPVTTNALVLRRFERRW